MKLTKIKSWLATYWQPSTLYIVLLMIVGALLWVKLGSLPGGYSTNELRTFESSTSLRSLVDYPLNAPFTAIIHGLTYLTQHSLLLGRLLATAIGLLTLTCFYWLVRHWHGERTAVIGTILFGASAWFLHTSRLGTPDVLLFGLLIFVACGVWLKRSQKVLPLLLCFGLAAILLYVPGMVWFIMAAAIWQWRTIDRVFKRHLWAVSGGALLLLAALVPLGLAIYHDLSLAKILAGLPAIGWPEPLAALKQLANVPLDLFVRNQPNPETWLGRVPVLDLFSTVMFALGGYLYGRKLGLGRSQLLCAVLILGSLLICLGGGISLTLIVPFVYILVAAGAGYLCDQWVRVFPRNPIARGIGFGLLTLAILSACSFYLRHYFIAWPHSQVTKTIFVVQEP